MPFRKPHLGIAFCLCCLITPGCGDRGGAPSRTDPAIQDARSRELDRRALARVPPEQPAAATGEVPADVLERVRRLAASRSGASADSLEVVRSEGHEWPSGAMGCPQPGVNYPQSPVRGYWIVLRHGGRDYDYRVSESGQYVTCEAMKLNQPPAR